MIHFKLSMASTCNLRPLLSLVKALMAAKLTMTGIFASEVFILLSNSQTRHDRSQKGH